MLEDVLARIESEHAQESVWIVGRETGRLLHLLVRVSRPQVILEIGTSVGYSALWLASALVKNGAGQLWTVESHSDRFARATRNIEEAGMASRIRQIKGHAPEVFSELRLPGPVDFAFFDATKMEHHSYLKALQPLFSDGALLVVDNVLSHRFGHMEKFIQNLHEDAHFEVVEIPVGQGLLIARFHS